MSQNTARHDPRAKSADEDVADAPARQPARRHAGQARQPAGEQAGKGGVGPDEPDEGEFEVVGDDDLGAADLGPLAPGFRDPDADSGRIRKIAR